MEIMRAGTAHIGGMVALLRQVGQIHHQGRPDLFRAGAQKYDETDLQALLKDETRPIFVACEGAKVLGYCFCIIKTTKDDPVLMDCKSLYIDDLCVDEDCRGKHIGRALYTHTASYAREIGCDSVTLNVWAFNESALRFYEGVGLRPQKLGMEMKL